MFLSWYEDERGKIEEWHSELTILTGEQRENFTLCIRIDIYIYIHNMNSRRLQLDDALQ